MQRAENKSVPFSLSATFFGKVADLQACPSNPNGRHFLIKTRNFRFIVALVNQGISSITNFIFLLYLVRALDPGEFGLYTIAFAVLLGAVSVLQGLFLIQMITQLPNWKEAGRAHLVGGVLILQILVCLFLCFSVAIVTHLLWKSDGLTALALLTAAAITAHAIKEFFIRYFFAHGNNYTSALYVNGVLALTLFLVVMFGPERWTSITALSAFFSAHLTSAVLALVLSGLPLCCMRVTYLREAAIAIAPGGGWASASALIYTARASAHTFIVAFLVGPIDVGWMNAARVLVTPATIIIPSLSNVILPEMVHAVTVAGAPRVRTLAAKASRTIFAIALLYSVVLMLVWDLVQNHILGDTYRNSRWIVALWCLYAMMLAIRSGMEWGLQALKNFKVITRINLIGTTVTIISVFLLAYFFSIYGAVFGVILGEAVTALMFSLAIRVHSMGRW